MLPSLRNPLFPETSNLSTLANTSPIVVGAIPRHPSHYSSARNRRSRCQFRHLALGYLGLVREWTLCEWWWHRLRQWRGNAEHRWLTMCDNNCTVTYCDLTECDSIVTVTLPHTVIHVMSFQSIFRDASKSSLSPSTAINPLDQH